MKNVRGVRFVLSNIYLERRNNLTKTMRNGDICILFSGKEIRLSRDQNYDFNVNKNFFYLTGIKNENLILCIRKIDGEQNSILFIEDRPEDKIKWIGRTILKGDALEISSVNEVKYLDSFDSFLNGLIIKEECPTIYFDFDRDAHYHEVLYSESYAKNLRDKYPNVRIKNIYPILTKLRCVKHEQEISKIREAIEITKIGLENVMRNLKPNMYEYQIESHFDFSIKYNGANGYAFKSIVASGEEATILHYIDNNRKIRDGELVLFDVGAEKNLYKADISRTFPANGKFTERQKQIYNIVLDTQIKVIEAIRPGALQKELNEIAKESLYLGLKQIGKLNEMEEISNYYYHGIGHLLGLDTHDVGDKEFIYEEGMVVTVEPGLYLRDEGIGIRIEDDVLVTKNGHEVLSKDIIKTVDEIEEFMKDS